MARVPRGRGCSARGRGRGGRGRGRGRVGTSFEWVAQRESPGQETDSQTYHVGSEGSVRVSVGAGGGTRADDAVGGPSGGATTGVAHGPDDRLVRMLAQILERLHRAVPGQIPVAEEHPAFRAMLRQIRSIGSFSFSGGGRPEVADGWRMTVERRFCSIGCADEYRVGLAVHFLEGDARLWWRSVEARRRRTLWTWGEFLAEFNARYFPQEAVDRLETQFWELVQGDRSVHEYYAEFGSLVGYAGRGMDEERAQMRRFAGGLRLELRMSCRASKFASLEELGMAAAAMEKNLREQDED